ncbi:hypothetical protein [Fibrivirga algicola]|uniref:hypothetical protein n=1 Tax=Fibrivirga algicola TaxID=2950420 RepID=UPI001419689C|nr:hypothetical protein [Fibrivirga algicola]
MLAFLAIIGLFIVLGLLGMSLEVFLERRFLASEHHSRCTHLLVLYVILSCLIYHLIS